MIRKIKHLIKVSKASSMIVYINHSIIVQISHQITLFIIFIDKFNLRFIRVFQYLFEFNFAIRHKNDKKNMIFNALFKLQTKINVAFEKKQTMFENLYDNFISVLKQHVLSKVVFIYYITLIKMSDDFKKRLIEVYSKDIQ